MTHEHPQADPTRERLLDEAEKLFAEKGFAAVSVREITTAAGAHLSAVNYHFGSKKQLYLAVFEKRWVPRARRLMSRLEELADQDTKSVEDMVRALAESFMLGFESEEERTRHHLLIHREISQPTEALKMISDQVTKPAFQRLAKLLKPCLSSAQSEEELFLYIFSVFSQVLFFSFGRSMVSRLTGREYDPAFRRQVAEHITRFSLYGLSGRIPEEGA